MQVYIQIAVEPDEGSALKSLYEYLRLESGSTRFHVQTRPPTDAVELFPYIHILNMEVPAGELYRVAQALRRWSPAQPLTSADVIIHYGDDRFEISRLEDVADFLEVQVATLGPESKPEPDLRPLLGRKGFWGRMRDRMVWMTVEALSSRFESELKDSSGARDKPHPETAVVPVVVYLSDESIHAQVERALEALISFAGLYFEHRDEPIIGSWFQTMRAKSKEVVPKAAVRSPAMREAADVGRHIVDQRLYLAQDAAITATLMQNLGPLISSLQSTKDAAIRVGALLVVKVDWALSVHQLTATQQARIDHAPTLLMAPHEIFTALNLEPQADSGSTAALP